MRTIRPALRTFIVTGLGLAGSLALGAGTTAQPAVASLGHLAQGAYFGVLLLLLVAALGQAWPTGDRNFAALALYMVLLGAAQAVSLGLAGEHLWSGDPQ